MSGDDSEALLKSVLEHHAECIGIEWETVLVQAWQDGIIVDVEEVRLGGEVKHRYQLAAGLEEFRVYAERLAAASVNGGDE